MTDAKRHYVSWVDQDGKTRKRYFKDYRKAIRFGLECEHDQTKSTIVISVQMW